MDEFELLRQLQESLSSNATPAMASRILSYLQNWNNARPLPPASNK